MSQLRQHWEAALAVLFAATFLNFSTCQQLGAASADPVSGCRAQCRPQDPAAERSLPNTACSISSCTLELPEAPDRFSLNLLPTWLPQGMLPSDGTYSLLLSDVNLVIPTCEPLWALQADACTFRVSSSWPNTGLQVGPGFVYFPFLSSALRSAAAVRLNVSCPLSDWEALVAEQRPSLLPCGTASVATWSDLQSALTQLQVGYARVLITITANVTVPGDPSAPPAAAATCGSVADRDASPPPLVVIYRNVTLAGLGAPSASASAAMAAGIFNSAGSSSNISIIGVNGSIVPQLQTEINLSCRRNTFLVQQPAEAGAGVGSSEGSGGAGSSSGRVVMTWADVGIVNVPAGPRSTWPVGLLSTSMWHVGVNRSKGAPVQLIHLRVSLILSLGQTRYFGYWYQKATAPVEDERQSAAWILDVVTPSVLFQSADDGSSMALGLTGSFLEKYNTAATFVPILTNPLPPPVDLWSLDEPTTPVLPAAVGFVADAGELATELNKPWTGTRVIVLLNDIALDAATWPKDGFQVTAAVTLSGPCACSFASAVALPASPVPSPSSSPSSSPQQQQQLQQPPTLSIQGLIVARMPPDTALTFRNLRVWNASVDISWALPIAPTSLPGVPAYDTWLARCLPVGTPTRGQYVMNGCEIDVPPDVFTMIQVYNNLPCDGTANNCTNPANSSALAVARFPYLPKQLNNFFDRIFRASGRLSVTQPDNHTILFRDHVMTSFTLKACTFSEIQIQPSDASNLSGRLPGGPPVSSPVAAPAPSPSSRLPGASVSSSMPTSCTLQTMFAILMSAPPGAAEEPQASSPSPQSTHGSASSEAALTGGIVAAVAVAAIASIVVVVLVLRRHHQACWRHRDGAQDAESAGSDKGGLVDLVYGANGFHDQSTAGSGQRRTGSSAREAAGLTRGSSKESRGLASGTKMPAGGGSSASARKQGGGATAMQVEVLGREDPSANGAAAVAVAIASSGVAAVGGGGSGGARISYGAVGYEGGMCAGDGCSAFSQSYAAVDMAHGKPPTMVEQLLGMPQQLQPQLQPQQIMATALYAGAEGVVRPPPQFGPGAAGGVAGGFNNNDANYPNNGQPNGQANGPVSSRGATPGGSATGDNVQRTLAGEIDGMIRRFEKAANQPSGPSSSQGGGRPRVLGSGGFGVVYKGEWRGLPVAIKVVLLQDGDSATRRERLVREVALSATLSHPNVVPTYHYTVQPVASASGGPSSLGHGATRLARATLRPPPELQPEAPEADAAGAAAAATAAAASDGDVVAYKLSIFMAYCDRGTLRDALRDGFFRRPWPQVSPQVSESAVGAAAAAGAAAAQLGAGSAKPAATPRRQPPPRDAAAQPACAAAAGGSGSGSGPGPGGGGGTADCSSTGEVSTAVTCSDPEVSGVGAALPMRHMGVPHHLEQPAARTPPTDILRPIAAQLLMQRQLPPPRGEPPPPAPDVAAAELVPSAATASAEAGGGAVAAAGPAPAPAGPGLPRALMPPGAVVAAPPGALRSGRLDNWQDLRAASNQALALFAALDVARGLEYLHSCNVIHGDLSLQNILLASTEPLFPDAVVAAAAAAAAASSGSVGASTATSGGTGFGGCGGPRGVDVMDRLPEETRSGSAAAAAAAAARVVAAAAAAGAATAAAATAGSSPRGMKPPTAPVGGAAEACGDGGAVAAAPDRVAGFIDPAAASGGVSGTADAGSVDDAEAVGASMSTCTQSGTLAGFFIGVEDTAASASAGGGGGGGGGGGNRRVLSVGGRLTRVQPLLCQVFKISDFGLSVRLEDDETHRSGLHQGTPYYTATEVLVSGKVSPAADVYSYGVCLWCLVHGISLCQVRHLLPPIFTPSAPTLLAHLAPDLHPGVRSLVRRCLAGDPSCRPTAGVLVSELQSLVQAVLGPDLAPLLLGAERREREAGRTVASSLMLDSGTCLPAAAVAAAAHVYGAS